MHIMTDGVRQPTNRILTYARFSVGPELEVGRTDADDGVAQLVGGCAQVRATATDDGRYHEHGAGTVVTAGIHGPVEHLTVVRQVRPTALAVRLAVAPSATAFVVEKTCGKSITNQKQKKRTELINTFLNVTFSARFCRRRRRSSTKDNGWRGTG